MRQANRSIKIHDEPDLEKPVLLEDAIIATGFGLYQIFVAAACGFGFFSGNLAVYVVSYILPSVSCEFQMPADQQTLIISSSFAGMFLGTNLGGYWSDVYGRRHMLWRSCLAVWLLLMAMAFAPSGLCLIIAIFLTGFASAGINIGMFVYTSESCSNRCRGSLLMLLSILGYSPFFVLPVMSGLILPLDINWEIFGFILSPWRVLVLACSLMLLICTIIFVILPETPKFLFVKGDISGTMDTLRTMYSVNTRKPKNHYKVTSVVLDTEDNNALTASTGFFSGMWKQNAVLFSKDYLKYTIFQSLVCAACVGVYNVVFMWLPQWNIQMRSVEGMGLTLCETFECEPVVESGSTNPDINLYESDRVECRAFSVSTFSMNIYIGAACCFYTLLLMKLADFFDKRRIIVFLLLGSAISLIGIGFARNIILINVLLGTAAILAVVAFPLCMNIIVDFYPTHVRSTAACFGFVCARVGSSLTSQIMGSAQQCHCNYVFSGLIALLFGTMILALFMPLSKKEEPLR